MILKIPLSSQYDKTQNLLFTVFVIISILNFGNYSFLSYTWDGKPSSSIFLKFIKETRIFLPILTVLYLISNKIWRKITLKTINSNKALFLLSFFFLIGSIFSTDIINSIIYSFWFLFSILLITLTVHVTTNLLDLIILIKYGTIVTVLLSLISLSRIITMGNEATFFSSKNYYAYPLLIYLICEIYIFSRQKVIKFKWLRILVIILILIILFISGRRTPTFCALAVLITYIYYSNKLFFLGFVLLISLFFTSILGASVLGFKVQDSLTFKRFFRILENKDNQDSSYDERTIVWGQYIEGFYDSPIFGNGINTNETTLERHNTIHVNSISYHNTFLHVLVESGIIGLSLFVFYLLSSFKKLFISFNYIFLIIIFIIPTVLINWVESNVLPGQVFFIYSFTVWAALKKLKLT